MTLAVPGGANSQRRCANLLFCKFVAENCMKMKEFGPLGACPWCPPRSANDLEANDFHDTMQLCNLLKWHMRCFVTTLQRSSVVSVHQSVKGGGGTCDNCPWCIGPHCKAPLTLTWDPLPWPQPPPDMGYRHRIAWPWSPLDTGHEYPLALRQPPPRYDMGHMDTLVLSPASDIWWPSLESCSNVFIGPHCKVPPPSQWYWQLVTTKAHTVGKEAVCIILECFLVVQHFWATLSIKVLTKG